MTVVVEPWLQLSHGPSLCSIGSMGSLKAPQISIQRGVSRAQPRMPDVAKIRARQEQVDAGCVVLGLGLTLLSQLAR